MDTNQKSRSGPVTFALTWLGVGAVIVFLVGIVTGLARGDVPASLGPIFMVGMLATAVAIVVALFLRSQGGSDHLRD